MALIDNGKRIREKALYASNEIEPPIPSDMPLEGRQALAREWRNKELDKTDWIASIPDHGQYNAYITYRQALRDWPTTDNFPDTKPTL